MEGWAAESQRARQQPLSRSATQLRDLNTRVLAALLFGTTLLIAVLALSSSLSGTPGTDISAFGRPFQLAAEALSLSAPSASVAPSASQPQSHSRVELPNQSGSATKSSPQSLSPATTAGATASEGTEDAESSEGVGAQMAKGHSDDGSAAQVAKSHSGLGAEWNWKGFCYVAHGDESASQDQLPEGKSFPLCAAAQPHSPAVETSNPQPSTTRPTTVHATSSEPFTTPPPEQPEKYCTGEVDVSGLSGQVAGEQQPGKAFDCRWRIHSQGASGITLKIDELEIKGADSNLLIFIGQENAQEMEYESAINVGRAYVALNELRSRPTTVDCPSDTVLLIFNGGAQPEGSNNKFELAWTAAFKALAPPPPPEPRDTVVRLCQSDTYDSKTCVEIDACDKKCGHNTCHNLDDTQCMHRGGDCVLKGSAMFMSCETCLLAYAQIPKGVYIKYYDLSGIWPDQKQSCHKMHRGVTYKGKKKGPTQGFVHLGHGSHCSVFVGIEKDSDLCTT